MRYRRLLLAPALIGLAAFGALIQSGASQPAPHRADCTTVISIGSIWIGSNCGKSGRTVIAPLARQPETVPAAFRSRSRALTRTAASPMNHGPNARQIEDHGTGRRQAPGRDALEQQTDSIQS